MAELYAPAPEPKTELGRYRVMSSTAGIRVSPLQFGGMSIGEKWNDFMGSMDKEQSFKLLDAYYDAGGNFIDTANAYQQEQSEEWIGEWMKDRGNRDHMVLATKFSLPYKAYSQGQAHAINYSGNHKRSLHVSLRDSLQKLQTSWIDVMYVHVWDHTTSIEEIMDSLDALVKSGKISYLGISDTPAWVVAAANVYARDHGKTQFSIYQGQWNVMLRDMEREIVPMCQHFGMAIAAWQVLGGGKFQTKKALEERKKNNEGRPGSVANEQTEQSVKVSEALANVAAELGMESVTAVALAYVMSKAPNVYPIIGGRKVEYLYDNIQALKLKLTDKQIAYLESVTAFDVGFPGTIIGKSPFDTGVASPVSVAAGPMAFSTRAKSITRQQ